MLSCRSGFGGRYAKKIDMNGPLLSGLVTLYLVLAVILDRATVGSVKATLVMDQDVPTRTCRYTRTFRMFQVRCKNLDLETIPNLRTEIEILDLTVNRLRFLTNDSLSPYKSLVYLYLGDNFLQDIEEGAFEYLQLLKVLDLSRNGCDHFPKNVFQLPYLQKLYLSDNKLRNEFFKDLDIKSPIEFLQLANNKLIKVPQLGPVPTLVYLNVSQNAIGKVSPEDLAPFCYLKILDISKNPLRFNGCECHLLNNWLNVRGIKSQPSLKCPDKQNCTKFKFSNRTVELYDECRTILQLRIETEQATTAWTVIACCISGFLVCLITSLYCVHKKNKRRAKKLKARQKLNAHNANAELLNGNQNHPENT